MHCIGAIEELLQLTYCWPRCCGSRRHRRRGFVASSPSHTPASSPTNFARIANTVQCHSFLSGHYDCNVLGFSIVRNVNNLTTYLVLPVLSKCSLNLNIKGHLGPCVRKIFDSETKTKKSQKNLPTAVYGSDSALSLPYIAWLLG